MQRVEGPERQLVGGVGAAWEGPGLRTSWPSP